MREIKFRGRRVEYSEWVYGYLIGDDVIVGNIVEFNDEYFNTSFWYKVKPETIGQFTGLKDKNGVEIHEGDIVSWVANTGGSMVTPIEWRDDLCRFICRTAPGKHRWVMMSGSNEYEIIGNRFEHPHLLPKAIDANE